MNTITYKCPNCDGGLVFNPNSQKFKCEYCLSEFSKEELERQAGERAAEETANPVNGSREPAVDTMVLYHCPSCGAEIVTDETTAAAACYYCHNPVVLTGRLSGQYKPDSILPFETDRKRAEETFKNWIRRKKYIPRDFYSPEQIEQLEGVYYPYWLYSCRMEGRIYAEGIKRRTTRSGDTEYLETSRYEVERNGRMEVRNVSRNALKKADRRLAEYVLPYDTSKLRYFSAGYLSGFKAERRDMDKEEFRQEVEDEVRDFALKSLRDSVYGYDSVDIKNHQAMIIASRWNYALLPVWVLTYRDKKNDKIYYFAMNGQNGKVCGTLPVSYGRLSGLFAAVFFPVLILFLLGGYLI